ncbi:MAG: hypothetical protein P1V97_36795, partial [Planctomycetota bacterium]|nr:hypothetical protein [Planctomycetota bacterium]
MTVLNTFSPRIIVTALTALLVLGQSTPSFAQDKKSSEKKETVKKDTPKKEVTKKTTKKTTKSPAKK